MSQACEVVLYACNQSFRSASVRHTDNACELAGITLYCLPHSPTMPVNNADVAVCRETYFLPKLCKK